MTIALTLLGLAATVATGLAPSASAVRGPMPAAPSREAYLDSSSREAVKFAGAPAQVVEAEGRARRAGGYIVCGTLQTADERLPFATLWREGEALEGGATLVGLTAKDRERYRHGEAFHRSVSDACGREGLAGALRLAP